MADKDKAADEDKKPADGEAADGADEGGEGKKKKKNPMLLIGIIVGGLVVVGGGVGAALYFTGVIGGKPKAEAAAEEGEAAPEEKGDDGKAEDVVIVPLGDMLVNLAAEGGRMFFLKLNISLQITDKKDMALIEALKPRIIDNFQVYLRELRIEDLRGSAGLYRLREELLMRVTEAVHPVRVKDVLFQEMLVSGG